MSDKINIIYENLKDSTPLVRIKALDTIGKIKPSDAIEIINPFLEDENIRVRVAAAFNLGRLADNQVIPYFIKKVLGDDDDDVRTEALAALDNYRDSEILKCLIAEVYRPKVSRTPRQEIAKQLRHYDTEEAVDALIILLHDEDVFVRDDTAESLLQLNRPRLVDVWKKALDDLSEDVRNIAITALTNLGCVEEVIDELVALLQNEDFFMRDSIAECLLKLNRPRLREVWEKFLNDQEEDVRDIAIKAIQELTNENLQ
jgi:HEAT repeat protein